MTPADLLLTVRPPAEKEKPATDRGTQWVMCQAVDRRLNLLSRLTREQRVELEKLKSELMN